MFDTKVDFVFDSSNNGWSPQLDYNRVLLQARQSYANDMLHFRGTPLFLNEVLDMIELPRTKAGQLIGWAPGSTVDFGIREVDGELHLKFNVDGPVWDLMED